MIRLSAVAVLLLAASPAFATPDAAKLERMVRQDCGSCHGMTLKGGLGSPLLPQALADQDEAALAATILDGRPGTAMPPWRSMLSEEDVRWIASRLKGGLNDDTSAR